MAASFAGLPLRAVLDEAFDLISDGAAPGPSPTRTAPAQEKRETGCRARPHWEYKPIEKGRGEEAGRSEEEEFNRRGGLGRGRHFQGAGGRRFVFKRAKQ
ncbi:hypothetical protein FTUN_7505 [Frigoriglobus tundricola]|uniref:Uncharacterized protein n=1 Tax=Frigoriglobus tundricola TaxID=2774151 RepID=A0A6M5Z3U3_9BACT|nr:hypothetical protein FTUN_7505 [Frigoriglobus tundricola]